MAITIQADGRRFYLLGNTYPIREQLRGAGAKWDADRKAWWTGKLEVAKGFESTTETDGETPKAIGSAEQVRPETTVLGRAKYKGQEYLVLWVGTTQRGEAAKLATVDGSRVFWADRAALDVTKRYEDRKVRGRSQPMTFGRLQRLREEYAEQRAAEREQKLIGTESPDGLVSEAEVVKGGTPGDLGEARWMRNRAVRIAVVIVGYRTPVYVRAQDAEDMGHPGKESGWYSPIYYRHATVSEYEALQVADPRTDGTCAAVGEAVVAALATAR